MEEGDFTFVEEEDEEEESMVDQGWMETAESVDSDEDDNAAEDVGNKGDDIEEVEGTDSHHEDEGDNIVETDRDVEAEDGGMAIIVNKDGGVLLRISTLIEFSPLRL